MDEIYGGSIYIKARWIKTNADPASHPKLASQPFGKDYNGGCSMDHQLYSLGLSGRQRPVISK